ncbi:MAG TPA: cache domain-containing protein [Spirochaetota bacterium]|nr:cache domain-containing protein [Spirochaetota bacterium]
MKTICLFVSVSLLLFSVSNSKESEYDKAVSLVKKAINFYDKNGKDETLNAVTSGKFADGNIYVFIYDYSAVMLAHPENKKLIGRNLFNVPDADGKYFRRNIVEDAKVKGSGWVDYKYKNPETGKVENKTTFFQNHKGLIFCCGVFK